MIQNKDALLEALHDQINILENGVLTSEELDLLRRMTACFIRASHSREGFRLPGGVPSLPDEIFQLLREEFEDWWLDLLGDM